MKPKPRAVLVHLSPKHYAVLKKEAKAAGRTVTTHSKIRLSQDNGLEERQAWDVYYAAVVSESSTPEADADAMLAVRKARFPSA